MNSNQIDQKHSEVQAIPANNSSELSIFEYGKIIWQKRVGLALSLFLASVFSIILSLSMPITYRASAVLMPPIQSQGSGILSSLSNLPLGGLISQSADETMSFVAILKSRTLMEKVVHQFDLVRKYEAKNTEEAVRIFSSNITSVIEDEGTIRVSVTVSTDWLHPDDQEDEAKIISAEMVNYIVQQLDSVNTGHQSQQASFQRMFIEGRYNKNIDDLKAAEDSLKNFQQKYEMIELSEQTRAAIEMAAIVKGQILSNQVQYDVLSSSLNTGHPDLLRIQRETKGLKKQLKAMNYGEAIQTGAQSNLFPAFADVPELGVQLMRRQRDVEIQNTLFVFLTQQYEEAKIQEAKNTPTVQVLDKAVNPEKKYRPRRAIIVISTFIFVLLTSVLYIIAKVNYSKSLD